MAAVFPGVSTTPSQGSFAQDARVWQWRMGMTGKARYPACAWRSTNALMLEGEWPYLWRCRSGRIDRQHRRAYDQSEQPQADVLEQPRCSGNPARLGRSRNTLCADLARQRRRNRPSGRARSIGLWQTTKEHWTKLNFAVQASPAIERISRQAFKSINPRSNNIKPRAYDQSEQPQADALR